MQGAGCGEFGNLRSLPSGFLLAPDSNVSDSSADTHGYLQINWPGEIHAANVGESGWPWFR